jgi:hypothetical protein
MAAIMSVTCSSQDVAAACCFTGVHRDRPGRAPGTQRVVRGEILSLEHEPCVALVLFSIQLRLDPPVSVTGTVRLPTLPAPGP